MKKPIPTEYLELVLCRDVYHCTPVDLGKVPLQTIFSHMICLQVEGMVNAKKQRRTRQLSKGSSVKK